MLLIKITLILIIINLNVCKNCRFPNGGLVQRNTTGRRSSINLESFDDPVVDV